MILYILTICVLFVNTDNLLKLNTIFRKGISQCIFFT